MEWLENILGLTSSDIVGILALWFFIFAALTIVLFWYMGKLEHFYAVLAGVFVIILAFGWYSGIIQSWVSDYETFPTQNSINYDTKEEYIQFWNDCITNMQEDEGRFAGAYCSGGEEGFADFNYYAKKESRRHK